MIVHSVLFSGARGAAVIKYELLQMLAQIRVGAPESAVERAFADARRAGENHEAPGGRGGHAAFRVGRDSTRAASAVGGQNSKRRSADFRKERNARARRCRK